MEDDDLFCAACGKSREWHDRHQGDMDALPQAGRLWEMHRVPPDARLAYIEYGDPHSTIHPFFRGFCPSRQEFEWARREFQYRLGVVLRRWRATGAAGTPFADDHEHTPLERNGSFMRDVGWLMGIAMLTGWCLETRKRRKAAQKALIATPTASLAEMGGEPG